MSLILDALNRSRHDREETPGIFSRHAVDGMPADHNWLQWILVGALAVAVLAIGALLVDRLQRSATAVEFPARESAPAASSLPGNTAASLSQAASAQVLVAPPVEPVARQAVPAQTPAARARADAAPAAGHAQSGMPKAPVDPRVAELYEKQAQGMIEAPAAKPKRQSPAAAQASGHATSAGTSRQEEAIDIEELVQKARAEMVNSQLSEHPVPFLSDLSQQFKDTVPSIMYLKHDYSGNPAASSVYINGKTLRAGSSAGGVKVEEILPDSVVLEYRGDRFRLRALNSWINL